MVLRLMRLVCLPLENFSIARMANPHKLTPLAVIPMRRPCLALSLWCSVAMGSSTTAGTTIELPVRVNALQSDIIEAQERCVEVEGAIRSSKTTGCLLKLWVYALRHPGIAMLASRWKQEDVDGQLKKAWRDVGAWYPVAMHPRWNGAEHSFEFPNGPDPTNPYVGGSFVYMHGLKPSEEGARYSKFRGKTLAIIYIGQAEELPEDFYVELKGRLSQPGYPHQIILDANPIDDDHWLATEFPDDGDRPNHRYITADIYANRRVLGEEVISGFLQDFPPEHPKHRTLIQGKRGVNVIGKPVYEGYFTQSLVRDVAFDPTVELLEGWDFGHAYPAVLWAQYFKHLDWLHVLGAVQGQDMYLEEFAPEALAIRDEWFPNALVLSWGDPSGDKGNQGIQQTAMSTLQGFDVPIRTAEHANDPAVRAKAIDTVGSLMFRKRFKVNPRCVELTRKHGTLESRQTRLVVTALSVGYVWDSHKNVRAHPNIRQPKKQTRYDHVMNDLEYITVGARIPSKPKASEIAQAVKRAQTHNALAIVASTQARKERAALIAAQKDHDDPHPSAGIAVRTSRLSRGRPRGGFWGRAG